MQHPIQKAISEAQGHLTKARLWMREGMLLMAYQEAERAQHASFEAKSAIDKMLTERGSITQSELDMARRSERKEVEA